MNFCGNATEAEDILQDVFIEIYRNLPALKDNMAFCAWQRQIAYRCCLRNAKKNSQTDILGNEVVDFIQSMSSKEPEPEKTRILHECIKNLPEKQRAAIILSALEQLKMKEIAQIMDCNVNAVKNLLFHGRKNLKKQIESLPKADREALKIRGFGFFALYPILRGSLYTAGSNTGKGVVAMKKAALGAAIAVGAGTAGFVMLQPKPKPEPKKITPASILQAKVEKKGGRLAIYVDGDVDYVKTYALGKSGKKVAGLTCDTSREIFYVPPKTEDFKLYLMDKAGDQRIFEFNRE